LTLKTQLIPIDPENKPETGEEMNEGDSIRKKKNPYAHLFRISHWLLSAGILFLLFTGVGIHSVSMPSWSIIDGYPSFYPTMRLIYWHKIAGILFAPASIVASFYFMNRLRRYRHLSTRMILNALLLGSGVVCTVTAIVLIYSNTASPLYHIGRFLHAACGMVIIPVVLAIHILWAFLRYFRLLLPAFAPLHQGRWLQALWLPASIAISWALFTGFLPDKFGWNELTAGRISQSIAHPDQMDRLPWGNAKPLGLKLTNGVGFAAGTTQVEMRALHNDEFLYMRIQWDDVTYNRSYRPWVRTEKGWMHLNPGGSDEKIYNEDKMAILFPIVENSDFERYGCSVFCHNSGKNRYGFHWTPNEDIVDVWHWKSVRTDPLGHVDDKYWQGKGALTADSDGRHGDPGESGYANNLVEDITNPIMLPRGLDSIYMGALVLSRSDIYTRESAELTPVGRVVPGAIISETGGDRADIRCHSSFYEGRWTLRIMRKLDTGSPYDVVFRQGGNYHFAVAAFDHSSFRHAYNQRTYKLHLSR